MEDKMTDAQKEAPIRIDHDNVDVADIMDQIKQRIAQRHPVPTGVPDATGEGPSGGVPIAPGGWEEPSDVVPGAPSGGEGSSGVVPAAPGGGEGPAIRVLRMLIRPFMPIVRPLLDRFNVRVNMDVNVRIDQMNDRFNTNIDGVYGKIDEMSGSLNMRIDKMSGSLNMRIDQVSDGINIRIDQVSNGINMRIDQVSDGINMRIDQVSDGLNLGIDEVSGRLNTTQENTKLLHALAHNLVLDLTKLRIEHEALKSKTRIMEKDFEVLGKREKVLEKRMIE